MSMSMYLFCIVVEDLCNHRFEMIRVDQIIQSTHNEVIIEIRFVSSRLVSCL